MLSREHLLESVEVEFKPSWVGSACDRRGIERLGAKSRARPSSIGDGPKGSPPFKGSHCSSFEKSDPTGEQSSDGIGLENEISSTDVVLIDEALVLNFWRDRARRDFERCK